MSSLQIISKSVVQLPADDYPPPGATIQLSFFDAQFFEFPIYSAVLLYSNVVASPSSFDSFKSSLAQSLPHFHPFVGDLTYLSSSEGAAIICSKDSGVVVIEAKSDLDICCLIKDSTPNVESLFTLKPEIVARELPFPILTVQFTSFSSGGIAVAVTCHHAAADGWGLWKFINSWANTCRHGVVSSELAPVHDRSIIKYPYKEELMKQMLKLYAPNLPKINPSTNKPIEGHIDRCTGRLFTVDPSSVKLLKQRAIQEAISPISTPTTFQILAAHFWIAVARAKGITSEDTTPTVLITPMDCRALLDPPIDTAYVGNCIRSIFVVSNGTNLMALDGLSKTCASIAEAISMAKENPLGGTDFNNPAFDIKSFSGLQVVLSGSPKLPVFDADFGWGKPDSHVVVPVNRDGVGIMTAGRDEGTVDLQVTIKGGMEEFVKAFEEGFRLEARSISQDSSRYEVN